MSLLPAEPPLWEGNTTIHETMMAHAFLSPAAILAPSPHQSILGEGLDEEPESFPVGSLDAAPIGLSSVHVRVNHDDVEAS